MPKNRAIALSAAVGLSVGLLAGPIQSALAGHTNRLNTAHLDGRSEVAPDELM